MKTAILSLCIVSWLLTGCELGPTKVQICKDGTCIGFEIPAKAPKSAKEVVDVQ